MSVTKTGLAVVAATAVAVTPGAAVAQASEANASGALQAAQEANVNLFARDRNVAVRQRSHEGYEAPGVPAGAFTLYPRLQVEVAHTDNLYSRPTGERSDWITRVRPELALVSDWGRHSLDLRARGSLNRHADHGDENFETWDLGADGLIDIAREANLALGGGFSRLSEPRSSPGSPSEAVSPVEYDLAQAYAVATRTSGRLRVSGRFDVRDFNYRDGRTPTGTAIDQDYRDRVVRSLSGRADYALSPATAMFVQVTGNDREYDVAASAFGPARDSSGHELLTGFNFEIGAVARGEIAVGYVRQDFDNAAYASINGLGTRAQVEWFPTQLTTLTMTASRMVEDSPVPNSGGYMSSGLSLGVDHELARNIVLSGQIAWNRDEYANLDREDDRLTASIGGAYLLNRNLGVSLSASRLDNSSSGANRASDFVINRLLVALVAQF